MEKTNTTSGNITGNGQSLVLDVRELNTVLFALSGTYALTTVFEMQPFDSSVWLPLQVARIDANTVVTSHTTANQLVGYEASCYAAAYVRVRSTAFTSGSLLLNMTGTSRAVEPAPVTQAVPSQTIATPTASPYALTTAATTNAAIVKSTAGNLFEHSI